MDNTAFKLLTSSFFSGLIFCCLFWTADGKAQNTNNIKVLSYNIHHANPPSIPDSIDLLAIAAVINESGADLVALQEVDVKTERSGKTLDQAKELARLTGMHYYFSKSIDHQGGAYGNAILSKFPIEEEKKFQLPSEEGTESRTMLVVKVVLPNGKSLKFAGTHLDFTSDSNSLQQARRITEILNKEAHPVILAGDFNALPESQTIAHLDEFFVRTCTGECPATIPVVNPEKVIDFIMFSPPAFFQVLSHQTLDETYASDHLPVLATLGFVD